MLIKRSVSRWPDDGGDGHEDTYKVGGGMVADASNGRIVDQDEESKKQPLVEQVTNRQRFSKDFKAAWWDYCDVHNTVADPSKHDIDFLETFLAKFAAGELPPKAADRGNKPDRCSEESDRSGRGHGSRSRMRRHQSRRRMKAGHREEMHHRRHGRDRRRRRGRDRDRDRRRGEGRRRGHRKEKQKVRKAKRSRSRTSSSASGSALPSRATAIKGAQGAVVSAEKALEEAEIALEKDVQDAIKAAQDGVEEKVRKSVEKAKSDAEAEIKAKLQEAQAKLADEKSARMREAEEKLDQAIRERLADAEKRLRAEFVDGPVKRIRDERAKAENAGDRLASGIEDFEEKLPAARAHLGSLRAFHKVKAKGDSGSSSSGSE